MAADQQDKSPVRTYLALRVGLLTVTAIFVVVIYGWSSYTFGTATPGPSISGYYHVEDALITADERSYFVLGDIFVGSLCSVGVLLMLYRGFTPAEDWALDLAGLLLIGVALFPTSECQHPAKWLPTPQSECLRDKEASADQTLWERMSWHGGCAVGFFVSIAISMWGGSHSVKSLPTKGGRRACYGWYLGLAIAMIALPLLVWLGLGKDSNVVVFWVEIAGVGVFWLYWLTKTIELWKRQDVEASLIRSYLGD